VRPIVKIRGYDTITRLFSWDAASDESETVAVSAAPSLKPKNDLKKRIASSIRRKMFRKAASPASTIDKMRITTPKALLVEASAPTVAAASEASTEAEAIATAPAGAALPSMSFLQRGGVFCLLPESTLRRTWHSLSFPDVSSVAGPFTPSSTLHSLLSSALPLLMSSPSHLASTAIASPIHV
jgi:hypothetical protein